MRRYLLPLTSRRSLDVSLSGGKGAGLAWLARHGYAVPDAYVVTSRALGDYVASLGGPSDLACTSLVDSWPDLQSRLLEGALPAALCRDLGRAAKRLGDFVAVRSSMVDEDSVERSFAGQLDTLLNVRPEELPTALKRCWASLQDARLSAYVSPVPWQDSRPVWVCHSMSVVIQRMVQPVAAGVAFGAHPTTGQPHVIIEAGPGLGENVVQGRIQPDRYVVDLRDRVIESSASDSGPVISQDWAIRLARQVRAISEERGDPQDVEWAWDGEQIWFLQTRPITSLQGMHVYSRRIVREMSDGLIKPLIWSVNTQAKMRNVFGRIFADLGCAPAADQELVRRVHSRIFIDATAFGVVLETLGLPKNAMEMLVRDEGARRHPPMSLKMLPILPRLVRFCVRNCRIAPEIEAFIKRHDLQLQPFRELDLDSGDLSDTDMLWWAEKLQTLHAQTQWYTFLGPLNMNVRNRILKRMVRRHAPAVEPSDLLRGLTGLKALDPSGKISVMAAFAQGLGDDALAAMATGETGRIEELLGTTMAGRELLRRFGAFMDEYGFLNSNGTDFSLVPWKEQPGLIWQSISRSGAQLQTKAHDDVAHIRQEAHARVRSQMNPVKRRIFDRLLATIVRYVDLRERSSLLMSEDSYQMRRLSRALGERLVMRGILETRDDVFYLSFEELSRAIRGEASGDLMALVARRKDEMMRDAEIEIPDVICCKPDAPIPPLTTIPIARQEKILVGIAGSSGTARGTARIIRDPTQAPHDLCPNDILVVPFTDVGWTPLFRGVGGVVAETGGQLSHSAIVAREYGLPAVVSVTGATQVIWEGQQIIVDGDRGIVQVVE